MQETLFIADVHLDPARPKTLALFLDLLNDRAKKVQALYILGDLFEVWVGDDEDEPVYQKVIEALRHLTDFKIPVWIMPGNRDFLLGEGFVARTGCQLLADPTVINLYGVPTLLTHGDAFCTLDIEYQAFRQKVRNPLWQQHFLAQPIAQRRLLAQQVRNYSQTKGQYSAEVIADVTLEAVIKAVIDYQVDQLIHGHTHRSGCSTLNVQDRLVNRWVVGQWQDQGAILVRSTAQQCDLFSFPSDK